MINSIQVLVVIFILFLVSSCKNNEKEQIIIKHNAKEIDFTKYNFTIDFQEEIIGKTILFEASLGDIFKENGNVYFLLLNKAYFKLAYSKNLSSVFKRNDEVIVVAQIKEFNFYQMNNAEYYDEDPWDGPTLVIKGDLLEIIKK